MKLTLEDSFIKKKPYLEFLGSFSTHQANDPA